MSSQQSEELRLLDNLKNKGSKRLGFGEDLMSDSENNSNSMLH